MELKSHLEMGPELKPWPKIFPRGKVTTQGMARNRLETQIGARATDMVWDWARGKDAAKMAPSLMLQLRMGLEVKSQSHIGLELNLCLKMGPEPKSQLTVLLEQKPWSPQGLEQSWSPDPKTEPNSWPHSGQEVKTWLKNSHQSLNREQGWNRCPRSKSCSLKWAKAES